MFLRPTLILTFQDARLMNDCDYRGLSRRRCVFIVLRILAISQYLSLAQVHIISSFIGTHLAQKCPSVPNFWRHLQPFPILLFHHFSHRSRGRPYLSLYFSNPRHSNGISSLPPSLASLHHFHVLSDKSFRALVFLFRMVLITALSHDVSQTFFSLLFRHSHKICPRIPFLYPLYTVKDFI